MQITHAQEISALEEEIARLKEQLYRYSHFVKEAKEERDDMRDAVMKLVEKGSVLLWSWLFVFRNRFTHTYSCWY